MADVAANSVAGWVKRLSGGSVPVLEHHLRALLALEPSVDKLSAARIAREILPDPLLTLNILHAANEHRDRHFGTEITTVEHALSMLGVTPLFERARRYATVETTFGNDASARLAVCALARRCQHAAWQARDWAVLRADTCSEEVWVAAMLAFLPELLLTVRQPEQAHKWLASGANGGAWMRALEVDREGLRAPLLQAWHVPELLRELLDPAHFNRPRVRNVLLAARLAEAAEGGWWQPAVHDAVSEAADLLRQLDQDMERVIRRNMLEVARADPWNPAPPAAAWLPMLPAEWPARGTGYGGPMPEQDATSSVPKLAADVEEAVCLMPHRDRFEAILREIETGGARDFKSLAGLMLEGLRDGLGLSRALVAQVSEDGGWMKPRFALGVDANSPLRRFGFPLSGDHLFARLMAKPQGFWYGSENRNRYAPHIPAPLRGVVGPEFFVMSLQAQNRPFAMIYADRGEGGCKLDSAAYVSFKRICLNAGHCLKGMVGRARPTAGHPVRAPGH
jgi:HD-like signal output (HDOD) protein